MATVAVTFGSPTYAAYDVTWAPGAPTTFTADTAVPCYGEPFRWGGSVTVSAPIDPYPYCRRPPFAMTHAQLLATARAVRARHPRP